jgi:hypothetical protein
MFDSEDGGKMSVDFYGTTKHCIPQDRTLYGQPF